MKGVPGLRVYEILDKWEDVYMNFCSSYTATDAALSQVLLENILSLKKLDTIIIRPNVGLNDLPVIREATIVKFVTALKSLPPGLEKRRLFIAREDGPYISWANRGVGRHLIGGLTEVDLS